MSSESQVTTVVTLDPITAFREQSVTDVAIEEMRAKYTALTISGMSDKKGYAAVRSARGDVKTHRVQVEKIRKALKEDALAYGRVVDSEAKRITGLLTVIEEHLEKQEEQHLAEIEAAKKAVIDGRFKALYEVCASAIVPLSVLASLSDADFATLLKTSTEAHRLKLEEQEREALRKAEAERLAVERETERLAQEKKAAEEREEAKKSEAIRLAEEREKTKAAIEELERVRREEAEKDHQRKAEMARIEAENAEKASADRAQLLEAQQEIERLHNAEACRLEQARIEEEHRRQDLRMIGIRMNAGCPDVIVSSWRDDDKIDELIAAGSEQADEAKQELSCGIKTLQVEPQASVEERSKALVSAFVDIITSEVNQDWLALERFIEQVMSLTVPTVSDEDVSRLSAVLQRMLNGFKEAVNQSYKSYKYF